MNSGWTPPPRLFSLASAAPRPPTWGEWLLLFSSPLSICQSIFRTLIRPLTPCLPACPPTHTHKGVHTHTPVPHRRSVAMAMTLVREAVSETTGVGSQFKVGLEKCATSTFISSRRFSSPLAVVLFHFSDCSLSHSLSLSLSLALHKHACNHALSSSN